MNYISSLEQAQGVITQHRLTLLIDGGLQQTLLLAKHTRIEIYLTHVQPCELYSQLDLVKAIRDVTVIHAACPLLLLLFTDGEYLIARVGQCPVLSILHRESIPLEAPLSHDRPLLHVARQYPCSEMPPEKTNCGYMVILTSRRVVLVEWQVREMPDQSLSAESSYAYPCHLYPHQIQHLVPLHTPGQAISGDYSLYSVVGYIMSDSEQFSSNFNQSIRFLSLATSFQPAPDECYASWVIQLQVKTYGAVSMSDKSLLVFTKSGVLVFPKGEHKHSEVVQLRLKLSAYCSTDKKDLMLVSTKTGLFLLSYQSQESLGIREMNCNSEVLRYKYLGRLQDSHVLTYLGQRRLMASSPSQSSYLLRLSDTIISQEEHCLQVETEFKQLGNVLDLLHRHENINSSLMTINQDSLLNTLQKGSHLDRVATLPLNGQEKPRGLSLVHKRFLCIQGSTYILLYQIKLSSLLFLQHIPSHQQIVGLHQLDTKYQFLVVYRSSVRLFSFDGTSFQSQDLAAEQLGGRVITHSVLQGGTLVLVDRTNMAMKYQVSQSLVLEQEVALQGQVSQVCLVKESLLVARWNSPEIEGRLLSDLEQCAPWWSVKHLSEGSICSMVTQENSLLLGTTLGLIIALPEDLSEEKVLIAGSTPVRLIALQSRVVSVSNRTMALSYNQQLEHYDQTYIGEEGIVSVQEIQVQQAAMYIFLTSDQSGSHLLLGHLQKNQKYISVPFQLQTLFPEYEGEQMAEVSESLLAISMNSKSGGTRSKVILVDLHSQEVRESLDFPQSSINHLSFQQNLLFLGIEKQQSQAPDLQHPQHNLINELVLYHLEGESLTQLARNCYMDRVVTVTHLSQNLFVVGLTEQILVIHVSPASHHTRNVLQQVCDKSLSSVMTSMSIRNNVIMVADYFKNILLYFYKDNTIYPLAYTEQSNDKLIEAQFYGQSDKSVIGAYLSGDLVFYGQNESIGKDSDILKLKVQCRYRHSEVITRMVSMRGIEGGEGIVYGTVNGGTGFICGLSQSSWSLLHSVQTSLLAYYSSLKHPTPNISPGLVLGDFLKTVSQLSQQTVQGILGHHCTLSELLLLLDSLEKNMFQ